MPVVSLQNVSVSYGKTPVLDDVSFSIMSGEVFACLGQNGAGKTTTLKTILGILEPTTGNISLFSASPRDLAIRRRIGFLPEQTYFYKYLT